MKCQGHSAYCMDTPPHKSQRSRFFGWSDGSRTVLCCQDCTTVWFTGSPIEIEAVKAKYVKQERLEVA